MSLSVSKSSYTGDPGIFGDIGRFIGGAVKSVPVVGGFVGGGIEMLANTLDPQRPKGVPSMTPLQIPQRPAAAPGSGVPLGPNQFFAPSQGKERARVTGIQAGGFLPGGAPPFVGFTRGQQVNGQGAPSGYHLNKSSYWTREGYVEKGTKWVRNRKRVNPANARATDRAIGRIKSAKRYAKKLSSITIRETCRKR